eukprot:c32818_g1_i1 orf=190-438(-)
MYSRVFQVAHCGLVCLPLFLISPFLKLGTIIWMANELTLKQLETGNKNWQKCMKQGKWAVYCGGKAIIEEFRKPKNATTLDP